MATPVATLRFVPRGCMGLFLSVCSDLVLHAPSTGSCPGPAEMLFVLPKLVFPIPLDENATDPKPRQKWVLERLLAAQQGRWLYLLETALRHGRPQHLIEEDHDDGEEAPHELPQAVLENVLRRISKGTGIQAWSMAKSAGVAPPNVGNLAAAERKLKPSAAVTCAFPP